MKPLFNPCTIGYEAKVWECLRRNKDFKDTFRDISAAEGGEAAYCNFVRELENAIDNQNPYAYTVISQLGDEAIGTWLTTDYGETCYPWRVDFGISWRDLPKAFQNRFEMKYDPPFALTKPNFESDKATDILEGMKETWRTYDLIAVPRFFRDRDHRKTVIAEIDQKLLRACNINPKKTKAGGSVLGAEREWAVFLLWEIWTDSGFGLDEASNLAAYQYHGRVRIGRNGADFSAESGRAFLKNAKPHNNRSDVKKNVKHIQEAIDSVFPAFNPC